MATSMTLTGLIPTAYAAMDQVSRELIGFIPNVQKDNQASSAAVGQTVRAPVVPTITAEDITPGAIPASSGGQTIGYTDVTITKSRNAPFLWSGEEQLSVNGQLNNILVGQFAQAFRTLVNEVESDLAGLYTKLGGAYGTAATTPFGTAGDHSDFAGANQLLDVQGAPQSGRVMIVGSAARAKLEGIQSGLFKVNEAGTDAMLRRRIQTELHGFQMGYSSGIKAVTKGTATSSTTNNAGYAVGATTITLAAVGTGTILAGDVITFAGDTNKYVVKTGNADVSAGGTIVLAGEGLKQAMSAATKAITVGNSYTANMFFHQNALLLAARAPAMPLSGDDADDVTTITDPVSGLAFQLAVYKQYRQVKFEVGLAWGVAAPNGKHGGILLG